LTLGDIHKEPSVLLFQEIICGLSSNQLVKCLSLDETISIECVIDSLRHEKFSTIEEVKLVGWDSDMKFPSLHTLGRQMPNLKSLHLDGFGMTGIVRETQFTAGSYITSLGASMQQSNPITRLSLHSYPTIVAAKMFQFPFTAFSV
jgi:hypothetical protein